MFTFALVLLCNSSTKNTTLVTSYRLLSTLGSSIQSLPSKTTKSSPLTSGLRPLLSVHQPSTSPRTPTIEPFETVYGGGSSTKTVFSSTAIVWTEW